MGNSCAKCLESVFGNHNHTNRYNYEAIPVPDTVNRSVHSVNNVNSNPIEIVNYSIPTDNHIIRQNESEITQASYQQPKSGFFLNYKCLNEIGVGSTSKCYRCIKLNNSNEEYACKVIDKKQIQLQYPGMLDQCQVEIKVLNSLNHPNIIKLEDYYETNDRIYMVMEVMNGGELFDYVVQKGTLSEAEASVIVRKITSAVAHMHSLNIIHRDLKPENLLLTSKGPNAEVKLIDFGLAKIADENIAKSFLGTKGYLAPEMLQRHSYDKAVDIWALGVIVFVLLCGCLPFDDDSSRIASESIAKKKFTLRFPRWADNLSESAKDLLTKLLDVNPKTRYTAEQALRHPWVSGKEAQINKYLQSPSLIGGRKELKSPMTPHMLALQNRMNQSNNNSAKNKTPLEPITEEVTKNDTQGLSRRKSFQ